jgi:1,4-alpha-glucan branching enzyme
MEAGWEIDAPKIQATLKKFRQEIGEGTFNNWSNRAHGLVRQGPGAEWELTVPLKPGRYRYKFLLNNTVWTTDGRADAFESDGFGGQCSVVVVK